MASDIFFDGCPGYPGVEAQNDKEEIELRGRVLLIENYKPIGSGYEFDFGPVYWKIFFPVLYQIKDVDLGRKYMKR